MARIRFIHTADIHLGSLLHITGELPDSIQRLLVTATMDSFARICDAAIKRDVDFVVISGDLFDAEARSVKAAHFFAEQCRRLKDRGIHVYVIAGNHDPLRGRPWMLEIPDNVHSLGGNVSEVCLVKNKTGQPVARVIGQSYIGKSDSRRMHLNYRVHDSRLWNIALLHTQLDPGNNNYVPCSIRELKENRNIHYWALGHIHQCRVLAKSYPLVVYPGIPQGRDFGEEGVGGCFLVELDDRKAPIIEFVPTASVIYKKMEVTIDRDPDDPVETVTDLEGVIEKEAVRLLGSVPCNTAGGLVPDGGPDSFEGYVVKWVIKGRGPLHDVLAGQEDEAASLIADNLRKRFQDGEPFIWTDSIVIQTKKDFDVAALKDQSPIFSEIESVVQKLADDEVLGKELLVRMGMIWDHESDPEDVQDYRFKMDSDTYKSVLEQAKEMVLEKLLEGREL